MPTSLTTTAEFAVITAVLCIAGCGERREPTASPPTQPPATAQASAQDSMNAWLGQWNGPEGTFLSLSKADGGYAITIQSLDGPSKYLGRAVQDRIEFERNGKIESIRATDGQATGMKWLLDKKNCLTIQTGEGFCRD